MKKRNIAINEINWHFQVAIEAKGEKKVTVVNTSDGHE